MLTHWPDVPAQGNKRLSRTVITSWDWLWINGKCMRIMVA